MRLLAALAAFLCLATGTPAQQAVVTHNAKLEQAYKLLDAYIDREMKTQHVPGISLAITDRNGLMRISNYGFADMKTRAPITPDTLFEIGSISKSFTATALLQLHEEGKFAPKQPVTTYLPWFSIHSKYAPITSHDLLTHTAGLPRDRDDVPSSAYQAAGVRDRWTGYAPGQHFAYSNIGYQIMGNVLGEITKEPYAETIRKRILQPLGMSHTEAVFTHDTYRRLATGYAPLYDDRPYRPTQPLIEATWQEYASGDGSIVSTATDMAAYVRMLLNRGAGAGDHRILSEESFGLLTQPAVRISSDEDDYYGYGIASRHVDGHRYIGHGGGMIGYSSHIEGDLDSGIGVVVLENSPLGPTPISDFALKVLRAALEGRDLPSLPDDSKTRVKNASDYQGVYAAADGRKLKLLAEGEQVVLEHGGKRIPLQTSGKDNFLVEHPDFALFPLHFGRENGKVVEAFYGGDWYVGERYSGQRTFTVPPELKSYVGHYRAAHPWSNNFRVVLRKGKLWLIGPEGDEATATPSEGGGFAVAEEGEPAREQLFFDTPLHGHMLRATLSGLSYYRFFTP